jgi:hypothetical protein
VASPEGRRIPAVTAGSLVLPAAVPRVVARSADGIQSPKWITPRKAGFAPSQCCTKVA